MLLTPRRQFTLICSNARTHIKILVEADDDTCVRLRAVLGQDPPRCHNLLLVDGVTITQLLAKKQVPLVSRQLYVHNMVRVRCLFLTRVGLALSAMRYGYVMCLTPGRKYTRNYSPDVQQEITFEKRFSCQWKVDRVRAG